ncbi:MAG: D-2-hydroxyacid dehydrogenase [Candidatus Krumholzibacteria bacterium]|nr:D-2-hydroxyacid dehydrogenase [Candidatus Krumholzibacteria bacterium]
MKFCRSLFLILVLLLVSVSAGLAQADKLTYLAGRLDEAQLAELQELAPNVVFLSGLSDEQALAQAAEIDGADAHVLTADFLAAATNLRWVQSWSAGVDGYLEIEGLRDNEQIVLTNMQGVHGPAIAEHVMGSLLALTRKLPQLHAAQREGRWDRQASAGATTLSGRTMFVVGMGGIGSQVARRAHAFDMKVLATVRNPDKKEKPAYVDRMGGAADLDEFLAESEVVVVALPLTDETRGLFDAAAFARLPAGSWFVNIGRGPIVDTDALVGALESGHLAGAALDVTDPEPLPADHVLWTMDNVIITPHVASTASLTGERRWNIIRENVRRFAAGDDFVNVVDKKTGY